MGGPGRGRPTHEPQPTGRVRAQQRLRSRTIQVGGGGVRPGPAATLPPFSVKNSAGGGGGRGATGGGRVGMRPWCWFVCLWPTGGPLLPRHSPPLAALALHLRPCLGVSRCFRRATHLAKMSTCLPQLKSDSRLPAIRFFVGGRGGSGRCLGRGGGQGVVWGGGGSGTSDQLVMRPR